MGMTMTQKILADHAGVKEVHAGELIEANVDIDKLDSFKKENQTKQEDLVKNQEGISEDERVKFLEAIKKISDTERSYAILKGIETQNEELKKICGGNDFPRTPSASCLLH